MVPFQCDLYHFRNLRRIDPDENNGDILLLRTIRRAIVDTFWSREHSKVETARKNSKKLLTIGERAGFDVLPATLPFPLKDTHGIDITVSILLQSLHKGRYQRTLKLETVRKIRSTFSNM